MKNFFFGIGLFFAFICEVIKMANVFDEIEKDLNVQNSPKSGGNVKIPTVFDEIEQQAESDKYTVGDRALDTAKKFGSGAGGVFESTGHTAEMVANKMIEQPEEIAKHLPGSSQLGLAEKAATSLGVPENFVNAPRKAINKGVQKIGGLWKDQADVLQDIGKTASTHWQDSLSDKGKEIDQQKTFEGSFSDAVSGGGKWHDNLGTKVAFSVSESIPAMIGAMLPGGQAHKSLEAARFAPKIASTLSRIGVRDKVAKAMGSWIQGGVSMGFGEGMFSASDSSKSIGDEVRAADIDMLKKNSPRWQEYYGMTNTSLAPEERESQAKELLAKDAESSAFALTLAGTTLTGTVFGGGILDDLVKAPRSFAGSFLSMPKEAWQEVGQSGLGEQMMQNVVLKKYKDSSTDIWDEVANASITGGLAGFVMGAAGLAHGPGPDTSKEGDSIRSLEHSMLERQFGKEKLQRVRDMYQSKNPDLNDWEINEQVKEHFAKAADEYVKLVQADTPRNYQRNKQTLKIRNANEPTENLLLIQENQQYQKQLGIEQPDIDFILEERSYEDQVMRDFAKAPEEMRQGAMAAVYQNMNLRFNERLNKEMDKRVDEYEKDLQIPDGKNLPSAIAAEEFQKRKNEPYVKGQQKADLFWRDTMAGIGKEKQQESENEKPLLGFDKTAAQGFELVDDQEAGKRIEKDKKEKGQRAVDRFFVDLLGHIDEHRDTITQSQNPAEKRLLELDPATINSLQGFELVDSNEALKRAESYKQQVIKDAKEAGYITDEEAAAFEKQVVEEKERWAKENKRAGFQKRMAELSSKVEEEEDAAAKEVDGAKFEFLVEAKKEAEPSR
jgi:hypothetical protein